MFAASKTAGAVSAAPPASSDPQFNYVSLLLNDTGTNGQQNNTFLDSSSNNFTITRNGTPTQGSVTPYWPNGQWSNYFSNAPYLSAPYTAPTQFGSGDFTVEAWMYLTTISKSNYLFAQQNASVNSNADLSVFGAGINNGGFYFGWCSGGSQYNATAPTGSMQANTWHHVACVRSGNAFTVYIDGVAKATTTSAVTVNTLASTPRNGIGGYTSPFGNEFCSGYISNLRMVKGTALYTSNFTPSTTPLTAVSGTSLLTCQSNRFKDNSSNNFAITVTGTPTVQAFEPFEPASSYATSVGGSGYFNGTVGNYISAPDNAAFQFGSGDFTIEGWVNLNSLTASSYLMGKGDRATVAGSAFSLPFTGYTMDFYAGSSVFSLSTFTPPLNAWFHIAIVRNGTTITRYINGVSNASVTIGTASINTGGTNEVRIGGYVNSTGFLGINGYISNLRIVKGTAVYTASFTPPTAPVTAITGTSLLLNCTNAGIYDAATLNDLVTVGNAQVSTAQAKFGSSSMAFDGSGDYLLAPSASTLQFGTGDFTVEMWWYPQTLASAQPLIYHTNDVGVIGTGEYAIIYNTSLGMRFYLNGGAAGSVSQGSTAGWSANAWYHVAVVKNGSTLTIYRNGVSIASGSNTATVGAAVPTYIGGQPYDPLYSTGYIEDLRITKGYARYTANFTPPTAPFPTR